MQSSTKWSRSFSLHLAHVCHPLQASLWCPNFWHLKHLWDVLLNSLKTIVDLHLFRSLVMIKCQDVSVGLDSFFAFSNGDPSYVCNSLFSSSVVNANSLFLINPLEVLRFPYGRFCILSYERFSFLICLLAASGCPHQQVNCHSWFS